MNKLEAISFATLIAGTSIMVAVAYWMSHNVSLIFKSLLGL